MESATILIPPSIRIKRYSAFRQNPIFLKNQNKETISIEVCDYMSVIFLAISSIKVSAPEHTIFPSLHVYIACIIAKNTC